jgi:hypothetical protein
VIGATRSEAGAALERLVDEGLAHRHDQEGFALYAR